MNVQKADESSDNLIELLIIDDEDFYPKTLKQILSNFFVITYISNPIAESKRFSERNFQLILLDLCFEKNCEKGYSKICGVDLIPTLRSLHPSAKIITYTQYGSEEKQVVQKAKKMADLFLQKQEFDALEWRDKFLALAKEQQYVPT